eukprot:1257122-Rhodomonas_salina.2
MERAMQRLVAAYAYAMRCPRATMCYAMSGTEIAWAMSGPRTSTRYNCLPIVLRTPYALSGTELVYAPTRSTVLTETMLLPGRTGQVH